MRIATKLGCLAAAICVTMSASAQDWAKAQLEKSPRHGEWVTIKNGSRNVRAFVSYPESSGKTPVVVVIHEIFGMTDWVRLTTDEIAAAGYIAVAPDLLSGMGPNGGDSSAYPSIDDARGAVGKLPPDQVMSDLNAAADYGKKLPASNGKLAVVGFCWGGGQSFRFATNRKDLSAAFVFYGPPPEQGINNIQAPVYGYYGGNDERIDATIPKAEEEMKAAGKTYKPVVYEGAGHGFMRAGEAPDASEANKKARDQAWVRLKELLKGL
ncbi:MAG: dienelactone hydrolase family protein [Terriglobales bacterium]